MSRGPPQALCWGAVGQPRWGFCEKKSQRGCGSCHRSTDVPHAAAGAAALAAAGVGAAVVAVAVPAPFAVGRCWAHLGCHSRQRACHTSCCAPLLWPRSPLLPLWNPPLPAPLSEEKRTVTSRHHHHPREYRQGLTHHQRVYHQLTVYHQQRVCHQKVCHQQRVQHHQGVFRRLQGESGRGTPPQGTLVRRLCPWPWPLPGPV